MALHGFAGPVIVDGRSIRQPRLDEPTANTYFTGVTRALGAALGMRE